MNTAYRWVDLPARILMAALFLMSGIGKLLTSAATGAYMQSYGVPAVLVWPAAAWEIGSGVLLTVGLGTRWISPLLAGWCLLTAAIFHTHFADHVQQIMFFKNMVMAGGFLVLARTGAAGLSVDEWLGSRRGAGRLRDASLG
jgi:putative oxidoreductase